MTILVNFKICDNSPDCNGIKDCPYGAFYFDEAKDSIAIDQNLCRNCGRCVKSCFVGAVKMAKNKDEQSKIQQEIDNDLRSVKDLFVDRYGAVPISLTFQIKPQDLEKAVIKSTKLTVLELYDMDSVECLIKSIPIKELFDRDIVYRKMEANDDIIKKYEISEIPALLFFDKGNLLAKIEGFYGASQKDELIPKINDILNGLS